MFASGCRCPARWLPRCVSLLPLSRPASLHAVVMDAHVICVCLSRGLLLLLVCGVSASLDVCLFVERFGCLSVACLPSTPQVPHPLATLVRARTTPWCLPRSVSPQAALHVCCWGWVGCSCHVCASACLYPSIPQVPHPLATLVRALYPLCPPCVCCGKRDGVCTQAINCSF